MPKPGHQWWHLVLSTKGSWLPGDPRGFRDHDHRLHSSGDYRSPPPDGEHDGLYRWNRRRSPRVVRLRSTLRPVVGEAILKKAESERAGVVRLSVSATHAHLLVETKGGYAAAKGLAGRLKQYSSHRIRREMPGAIWSKGGNPIAVRDASHHRKVLRYIRDHVAKEGAWYWTKPPGSHGD